MKYLKILLILIIILPYNVYAQSKAVVDITEMSIVELADALDKGYLTSELLVTLYLERIEAYNEQFNAINQINENALTEAKALDKEREEGKTRSLLHGIPIIVKTNIDVQGLATTAGAKALSDNYSSSDAQAIAKLKEAGAIIIASANMSEFAFSAGNSYSSYGQVRNAFNPEYTPYGSSGGSAVSLALSFASASLGTDTNSSVRVPAAAAGLVGLRPSLGLISTEGVIPYDTTRDTIGIMTKTVEDNAIILSIINEKDNNYTINDIDLSEIKIGVINGYLEGTNSSVRVNNATNQEIITLTKEKLAILEEAGVELIYIDELINNYYYNIASSTMSGDSFCDGFNAYIASKNSNIKNFEDLAYASQKVYTLNGYLGGCNGNWEYDKETIASKKSIFANHINEIFEKYNLDLIVYPTTKNKIFKLGQTSTLNAPGSFLGSVIGYPSLTVPIGYIDEFPYGLEFFSLKDNEQLIYNVANSFEKLNNLDITNSNLAPALYDIPSYVNDLKDYYEFYIDNKDYNDISKEAQSYFKEYNQNEDSDNQKNATKIINLYKERQNELNIKNKIKQNLTNKYVIVLVISFLIIKVNKILTSLKKHRQK